MKPVSVSGSGSGPGLGPSVQEASPEFNGRQLLLPVSLQRPKLPERPRPEGEEKVGPRVRTVGGWSGGRRWLGQRRFSGRLRTLEFDVTQLFEPQR